MNDVRKVVGSVKFFQNFNFQLEFRMKKKIFSENKASLKYCIILSDLFKECKNATIFSFILMPPSQRIYEYI